WSRNVIECFHSVTKAPEDRLGAKTQQSEHLYDSRPAHLGKLVRKPCIHMKNLDLLAAIFIGRAEDFKNHSDHKALAMVRRRFMSKDQQLHSLPKVLEL